MGYIQGEGRNQATLFPMVLDDFVPADHVCRVIDAFVETLVMSELGFERAQAAETGRPGYDPRDLLNIANPPVFPSIDDAVSCRRDLAGKRSFGGKDAICDGGCLSFYFYMVGSPHSNPVARVKRGLSIQPPFVMISDPG